jgi:AbrB family looped-hinge helix DNA binding protein
MNISNTHSLPTAVTRKGQVTIPAEIRQHLGIKPKDKVQFEVIDDGSVRVVPASPSRLADLFQSIKPSSVRKDDKTLRREFEEGVAERVLGRDTT